LNKPPHKKPIGEDGPIRVSAPQGQAEIEWRKIEHPPEKRGQETAIATAFIDALNDAEKSAFRLSHLEEDDFDFEVHSDDAKRYLELQGKFILIKMGTAGSHAQSLRSYCSKRDFSR
jgi:hypothetical protein